MNKMLSCKIFHMPMQQTACFSKHSVHKDAAVSTPVHAHALPPPLTKQSIKQSLSNKQSIPHAGNLGIEKTRSRYFMN